MLFNIDLATPMAIPNLTIIVEFAAKPKSDSRAKTEAKAAFQSCKLAAVFPRRIPYNQRIYFSAIPGFDNFQNRNGVIAVIFRNAYEFAFQIGSQILQDRRGSFPFVKRLAIYEAVGFFGG